MSKKWKDEFLESIEEMLETIADLSLNFFVYGSVIVLFLFALIMIIVAIIGG